MLNRQLQSRDMVDDIVANQTNLTGAIRDRRLEHALATGLEFSRETSENFARTARRRRRRICYNPNPTRRIPGPIVRTGAWNDATADSAAAYAFDTVEPRPAAGS